MIYGGTIYSGLDALQLLNSKGIRSPDVALKFKLKVDNNTMIYFGSREKRSNFITKYYNRRTKKFNFESGIEKQQNINQNQPEYGQ